MSSALGSLLTLREPWGTSDRVPSNSRGHKTGALRSSSARWPKHAHETTRVSPKRPRSRLPEPNVSHHRRRAEHHPRSRHSWLGATPHPILAHEPTLTRPSGHPLPSDGRGAGGEGA